MSPAEQAKQRDELLTRIRIAFDGVTREGGMSWSDSWASDGGPASDCPLYPDADRHWSEVVEDPRWTLDGGWGGFNFLDAIGLRYYLPAALTRCINSGGDCGIAFTLSTPSNRHGHIELDSHWKLISVEQWRCVSAVAEYLVALSVHASDEWSFDEWTKVADHARGAVERLSRTVS